jgi:hypothetical protein
LSRFSRTVASTVNNETFAERRMQDCSSLNADLPVNFMPSTLNRGDVPQTVQDHNRNLIAVA